MKKLIYLISPNKINKYFYTKLEKVLSYGNVKFFQLRIKKTKLKNLINISNKIKKITKKHFKLRNKFKNRNKHTISNNKNKQTSRKNIKHNNKKNKKLVT